MIKPLKIEPTHASLEIILDADRHYMSFVGESRPENVKAFFIPILDWITDYTSYVSDLSKDNQIINTKAVFKLEYFNSSSAKFIIDIISAINSIKTKVPSANIQIDWLYAEDDEDLFDSGKEFVRLSGIEMNFISF